MPVQTRARKALRVLLVEDCSADAQLVLAELSAGGYDVTAERVQTAAEMRAALADQDWQLVISDYSLPTFNAPAALAIAQACAPDIPFIIVSGTIGEDVAVTALKAGADDFIVKGKLARLLPAIERELREVEIHRAQRRDQETLERTLKQSEAQAAYALAAAGAGVWQFDLADGVVQWSKDISVMFGMPLEQTRGTLQDFRERVVPEDWTLIEQAMALSLEHDEPYRVQFRVGLAEGKTNWINAKGRVVRDTAGRPVSLVGIAMDVSDRKALEEELRQSQKLESIGRLAGGIAHDFNNLLTAILGYTEMAIEQVGPDQPLRKDLDEIRAASERAVALTRQLLAFSRKQTLHMAPVDLNEVVLGIRGMLQRMIGEEIEIALRLAPSSLPPVLADRIQVEQVLMNLMVNARDAMPRGGVIAVETALADAREMATVTSTSAPSRNYVRLRVIDTGTGMDEATQARIFEPFFTTKGVGKGTGLGLSMVYGVTQQLGGHIAVASRVDQGTTFSLYLPEAVDRIENVERPQGPKAAVAPAQGREGVLVVEDQESVRQLVSRILSLHGYRVLEAGSSTEALALFTQHRAGIALLVTDVMMPQVRGPELAAQLCELKPDLKVLFISGYAGVDIAADKGHALQGSIVEKPFTATVLLQAVRGVLDEHSPRVTL